MTIVIIIYAQIDIQPCKSSSNLKDFIKTSDRNKSLLVMLSYEIMRDFINILIDFHNPFIPTFAQFGCDRVYIRNYSLTTIMTDIFETGVVSFNRPTRSDGGQNHYD